jgi:hypothetical protein
MNPTGQLRADGEKLLGRKKERHPAVDQTGAAVTMISAVPEPPQRALTNHCGRLWKTTPPEVEL